MYFSPRRQRGHYGAAGAHTRQVSADAHEGTRHAFLRRHEMEAAKAAHGSSAARKDFLAKLFSRTVDTRNLRLAWDYVATSDGQAPGVDNLRCEDLDTHEVWSLTRALSDALRDDTYRPHDDRKRSIPKGSGRGMRMLSIPTVIDRTVQRAVVQIVQPYLDPRLDDHSFAYRPKYSRTTALAKAEELAVIGDRWVWITEDLKDAFDHVPQRRLLDTVRIHVPDDKMMHLIERLAVTSTGKGLRQGGNLSPLLLNVYLDHHLDKKGRRLHPNEPLLRWADDILIMCRNRKEASEAYQDLEDLLLPAGMRLKASAERSTTDLGTGAGTKWLGYELHRNGTGLKVDITDEAWESLRENLREDQDKTGSPLRATDTIQCWITEMGPCYTPTDLPTAYKRIDTLARDHGFDEIPSLEEVGQVWQTAHERWQILRHRSAQG